MLFKPTDLTIYVTRPGGRPARALANLGVCVRPIEDDHGNVDRYILSDRLAIERRDGTSLLQGITDKTLFTSAIYLREHFELPVLLIEGEVDYEYTYFDPQAVRGAVSSMVLLYGMTVLATPELEETVKLILMMARQEQIGIPEISLIPKRKATDLPDMQRRVVEMLPGCGLVVARELLQHFGSVEAILGATEKQLRAVRGIGKNTAAEIRRVVTEQYRAVDTEKQLEEAIAAEPGVLFESEVTLLDRQHYIYSEDGQRQFVDMVFLDHEAEAVVFVELKRDRLCIEHCAQLRSYLDNAERSELVAGLLEGGMGLAGVLVTVGECDIEAEAEAEELGILACSIDREPVIEVLLRLRGQRRGEV